MLVSETADGFQDTIGATRSHSNSKEVTVPLVLENLGKFMLEAHMKLDHCAPSIWRPLCNSGLGEGISKPRIVLLHRTLLYP